MTSVARTVELAHALPGRTRLRIDGPRLKEHEAAQLAAALQALPGMEEVAVHRRTGSVLCVHAPELSTDPMVERTRAVIGAAAGNGEARAEGPPPTSAIALEI